MGPQTPPRLLARVGFGIVLGSATAEEILFVWSPSINCIYLKRDVYSSAPLALAKYITPPDGDSPPLLQWSVIEMTRNSGNTNGVKRAQENGDERFRLAQ